MSVPSLGEDFLSSIVICGPVTGGLPALPEGRYNLACRTAEVAHWVTEEALGERFSRARAEGGSAYLTSLCAQHRADREVDSGGHPWSEL